MKYLKNFISIRLLIIAIALASGGIILHTLPTLTVYAENETVENPTEKETVLWGYPGYASEFGGGCLKYNADILTGNYIFAAYYTDAACLKLKSIAVYTAAELGESHEVPLGDLNLKKGGFFKVYDELTDVSEVKVYEIPPERKPIRINIKVKVEDLSKDTLLEALKITVDNIRITEDNIENFTDFRINETNIASIQINKENGDSFVTVNNDLLQMLKLNAKAYGCTFSAHYHTEEGYGYAKFKIPAVPKAPKVTVDYVNGTYILPKDVSYTVTTFDEDGKIMIPEETVKPVETSAKLILSVDEILKASITKSSEEEVDTTAIPETAVLIAQTKANNKKQASMQIVYKVKKLDSVVIDVTGDSKDTGLVKVGESEIASLKFTKTGVTITAKADLAYYDKAKNKWVTLKTGKTTKELALANDGKAVLKIKKLGTKASKTTAGQFGSSEAEITNNFIEK